MKCFWMLSFFLLVNVWSIAQETGMDIERSCGGFRNAESKEKIDKEYLNQILSPELFTLYSRAHMEYVAAIPFWVLSAIGVSASTVFAVSGVVDALNPPPEDYENPVMPAAPFLFVASGVSLATSLVPLIPAVVLTIDSHHKLDQIATDHNNRKGNPTTVKFGVHDHGFCITFNF